GAPPGPPGACPPRATLQMVDASTSRLHQGGHDHQRHSEVRSPDHPLRQSLRPGGLLGQGPRAPGLPGSGRRDTAVDATGPESRIHLLLRRPAMAATPAKPPAEKLDPAVVRTALILVVGGLAVVFDTTIVSVALHTLAVQLGTSGAASQAGATGCPPALGLTGRLGPGGVGGEGGVDVVAGRVARRLGRVQPGVECRLAHRRAGGPGHRRGVDAPADEHADLPGWGRQVAGAAGYLCRAAGAVWPDLGPADRRRHPDPPELAVHVLGERAVLRHRPPARLALPAHRPARPAGRRSRQTET